MLSPFLLSCAAAAKSSPMFQKFIIANLNNEPQFLSCKFPSQSTHGVFKPRGHRVPVAHVLLPPGHSRFERVQGRREAGHCAALRVFCSLGARRCGLGCLGQVQRRFDVALIVVWCVSSCLLQLVLQKGACVFCTIRQGALQASAKRGEECCVASECVDHRGAAPLRKGPNLVQKGVLQKLLPLDGLPERRQEVRLKLRGESGERWMGKKGNGVKDVISEPCVAQKVLTRPCATFPCLLPCW